MKLDFNKKYTTIAVYAFLVIAASITFFYLINEHTTVSRVLGMVFNLMMPFIYGAALAYILNPILNWLERKVFPKIFRDKLSRRGQRRLGVLVSFLFAAAVVAVFLAILIPQLIESVDSLARSIYAFLPQAQQNVEHLLCQRLKFFSGHDGPPFQLISIIDLSCFQHNIDHRACQEKISNIDDKNRTCQNFFTVLF